MESVAHSPFDLQVEFPDPLRRRLMSTFKRPLERVLGLDRLSEHYASVQSRPGDFAVRSLSSLNISYDVTPDALARIPKSGPDDHRQCLVGRGAPGKNTPLICGYVKEGG